CPSADPDAGAADGQAHSRVGLEKAGPGDARPAQGHVPRRAVSPAAVTGVAPEQPVYGLCSRPMNEAFRLRLLLVVLVAVGALIFSVSPAGAQFSSQLLEVTGVGGRPVGITGDVAASVSTGDGVYLAVAGDNAGARLQVEATGIGGGA